MARHRRPAGTCPRPGRFGTAVGVTTVALGLVGFALGVSGRTPMPARRR